MRGACSAPLGLISTCLVWDPLQVVAFVIEEQQPPSPTLVAVQAVLSLPAQALVSPAWTATVKPITTRDRMSFFMAALIVAPGRFFNNKVDKKCSIRLGTDADVHRVAGWAAAISLICAADKAVALDGQSEPIGRAQIGVEFGNDAPGICPRGDQNEVGIDS